MRIAHVCPFYEEQIGGSERFVSNIAHAHARRHDVHIYTTTRFRNRTGSEVHDGVTVHRTYSPVTIWNIDPVSIMIREIADSDADVIHIHSYVYSVSVQAALAKLIRRKKSLLQLHGGVGSVPYRAKFMRRVVKHLFDNSLGSFVIRSSDLVISVSHRDLEYVSQKYSLTEDRLRYVPNVVNTEEFFPRPDRRVDDELVLLYVGDIEQWKGIHLLMDWLRAPIHSSSTPLVFRFVGQGTLLPDLVKLKDLSPHKDNCVRIEVLGPRTHNEIPQIMRDSDALILPSYWEGMPTVVLEAMSCGLPVISTPVGDIPRVIVSGQNGIIIDRSLESLSAAINEVAARDGSIADMRTKARQTVVSQFSIDKVSQILIDIYKELCSD